jgi:hypothetical protein
MWSSRVKTKDTTQVMHIAKLKDDPKRAAKFSQMILEKGFWNGMMEGKKMCSYKNDFEVAMFFSSQNIDFPFLFEEAIWAFLFSFFFSLSFFLCSVSLRNRGIWWYLRSKTTSKILFKWHGMIWLIHNYEDGGVVDISAVDT